MAENSGIEWTTHIHRQAIINHFADHGTYPEIGGVEKASA